MKVLAHHPNGSLRSWHTCDIRVSEQTDIWLLKDANEQACVFSQGCIWTHDFLKAADEVTTLEGRRPELKSQAYSGGKASLRWAILQPASATRHNGVGDRAGRSMDNWCWQPASLWWASPHDPRYDLREL